MSRRSALQLLTGLLLVCLYTVSYTLLLQHGRTVKETRSSRSGIWNLPPIALLALAGEFKGVLADYLTLEVGAQLGTELVRTPQGGFKVVAKQYDWPSIHRLFVASQILDPSFAQTYIVAQGWLPWEPAHMVTEAQQILKTAAENRPWDWQPTHKMGFNHYYFLNQPGEAGKLFLEAAKTPNAPVFLSILGARLAQKGGETKTAIVLMKSMLLDKNPKDPDFQEMNDRLLALEGILILEQSTKEYQEKFGALPVSLDQLQTSGILATIPPNPYKVKYCIDAAGILYFDQPDCQKPQKP